MNEFRDAMIADGLEPPHKIEPGRWYRFPGAGKQKGDAGRCKLFADGAGGVYLDLSTGLSKSWGARRDNPYTPAEKEAFKKRCAAARAEREAEDAKAHAAAAIRAAAIWERAQPASADHPYLRRKGVQPHGLREHAGQLVVPLRDATGALHSLQFIGPDGGKRFLTGARAKGCFHLIGEPGATLCVCEGWATGASIHAATGYATAVAFNAGNLEPVARALRAKFPDSKIIVCGDFDQSGVGQNAAREAANAVGGSVALPEFAPDELARPKPPSDWNDLAQLRGPEAMRAAIAACKLEPEPLPALPDVTPFDYSYLPDAVRPYVRDISERMQCPPDFAAVAVLVMIATLVGRKVGIRPMRRNDWTVIPNLWGAVVGNSGVMKSPTLAAAMAPIKKLQAAAFESFNKAMAEHDAQAALAKMQQSVNQSKARASLKKDQSANVLGLLQSSATDDAPILKRYLTNNSSYEALGELLIENPSGLMVEADEIIGLLKQLDASGQEVARSFYLTAADGDKPYTFDRIMRGKGLHIEALCLSIIGGIQPGVLAEYVRQATGGGAGADGLLQRFGLMVYPDISPDWREVDRYPDRIARDAVTALAERLDSLNPADIGAEADPYGAVPFLRFDDAAQASFSEWRTALERRLRSGEDHPAIISHLSKYRKLVPSLALLNHLCDAGSGAVGEVALLRAISCSEYLESHARRIYSYATRPDIDAARTLLSRLASGKLSTPFTARDLYRAGWTGLETPAKAQAAIGLLLEYKHLSEVAQDTGGRPTCHFFLNSGAKK